LEIAEENKKEPFSWCVVCVFLFCLASCLRKKTHQSTERLPSPGFSPIVIVLSAGTFCNSLLFRLPSSVAGSPFGELDGEGTIWSCCAGSLNADQKLSIWHDAGLENVFDGWGVRDEIDSVISIWTIGDVGRQTLFDSVVFHFLSRCEFADM